MYYKERIVGAITYGILLLFFSYLIRNNNKFKRILYVYAFILSVLAYFYIPNPGYDLERINATLSQYYQPMNLNELFRLLGNSFTPSVNILYYVISKTNHFGLLPFTASLVFYLSIFSIFSDICLKYNICGTKRFLYLIFIMSLGTYLEVISNIRCMTAFAMIAFCVYNEIFNHKSLVKHLPIYFIAGTMHLAALAVIMIRFAIYPLQKAKRKILYALLPLSILVMIYICFPNFVNQIFFTESYYKENVSYMYFPEFVLMMIITTYIIFIKLIHWKYVMSDSLLKKMNFFAMILLLIMIVNINEYSIFHRIGTLHFLINMPIMGKYLSLLKRGSSITIMFIISAIILFIAAAFGNLSGFKYFIFS